MIETAIEQTESAIVHSTFRVTRHYSRAPARVFQAFADKEQVRRWRVEGDGFDIREFSYDFRVGGGEVKRFAFGDGPEIRLDAQFQDIAPHERIVFSYRVAMGDSPMSISLTTVEFRKSAVGTELVYTEQGVFFGGREEVKGREEGTRLILDSLAKALEGDRQAANG
jgi:uncharacterized protein YndB with AHSA1/START domain